MIEIDLSKDRPDGKIELSAREDNPRRGWLIVITPDMDAENLANALRAFSDRILQDIRK